MIPIGLSQDASGPTRWGEYATLKEQLNAVQDFGAKQATRDQIKVTIRDYLWADSTGLPGSYGEPEIQARAEAVFAHLMVRTRQGRWHAPESTQTSMGA